MPIDLLVRFQGRKTRVPLRVPITPELKGPIDVLYPPLGTFVSDPEIEAAASKIKEFMKDNSLLHLRSAQYRRTWIEVPDQKKLDLGDLTFGITDLPWESLYQEAKDMLSQFKECEIPVQWNLREKYIPENYLEELEELKQQREEESEQYDRQLKKAGRHPMLNLLRFLLIPLAKDIFHIRPKGSSISDSPEDGSDAPEKPHRTIREGMAHPEETLYCRAVLFYRKLQELLKDYPTMSTLFERYCLDVTSEYYYDCQMSNNFLGFDPQLSEYIILKHLNPLLTGPISTCNDLVVCSEYFENFLRCYPEAPNDDAERFLNATDTLLSACAYKFIEKMVEQLEPIVALQPHLKRAVDNILVTSDKPNMRTSDQLYALSQLHRNENIAEIEKQYQTVTPRFLSSISFSEESAKARSHPDASSRLFFSSKNISALAAMEFVQMCSQHQSARYCARCGMPFISSADNAKFCTRTSPNGGKRTCREANSAETAANNRANDEIKDIYTKVGNRLNTGLERAQVGKADRSAIMTLWRKAIAPIREAAYQQDSFDAEAFDMELEAAFEPVKAEYFQNKRKSGNGSKK